MTTPEPPTTTITPRSGTATGPLVHTLLGCLFYGAFVTPMLALSRPGLPGWALPAIGGAVFSVLVGL